MSKLTVPWQRLVLVPLAIVLAYFVGVYSLAGAVRNGNPDLALQLVPNDAIALGNKADRLIAENGDVEKVGAARVFARAALQRDATSVAGARTLGLGAALAGETARADRLMAYSRMLTRRDLGTTFYLVNRAVADNRVGGALENFDIALRTSPASADTLFPILAGALADDQLAAPIMRLFAHNPPWLEAFAGNAPGYPPSVVNLSRVLGRLPAIATQHGLGVQSGIVLRLVKDGQYRDALAYYRAISAKADGADTFVRNGLFARQPRLQPLEWNYSVDSTLGAEAVDPRTGGGLKVFASDSARGTVATELLVLAAGRYRLLSHAANAGSSTGLSLTWTVTCADGTKAKLGSFASVGSPDSRIATGVFDVPAGGTCNAQWLALEVAGSAGAQDIEAMVHDVALARVDGGP